MIADSAAQSFERYNALLKKFDAESAAHKECEDALSALTEQQSNNKKRIKELEKELKAYKSVVENYIYPEIANELLVREGAKRKTEEIIRTETLENNIITATTDIRKKTSTDNNVGTGKGSKAKSKSNVIEGLFKLED